MEADVKKTLIRVLASCAVWGMMLAAPAASHAQMDLGPKVEKTYGEGLPRDRDRVIFSDDQYPVRPLTPAQKVYASIDGARMKRQCRSSYGSPSSSAVA